MVLDDVLDGFVSVEAARDSYGVVIDLEAQRADESATEVQRKHIRAARGDTKMFHRFNYFQTESEEFRGSIGTFLAPSKNHVDPLENFSLRATFESRTGHLNMVPQATTGKRPAIHNPGEIPGQHEGRHRSDCPTYRM